MEVQLAARAAVRRVTTTPVPTPQLPTPPPRSPERHELRPLYNDGSLVDQLARTSSTKVPRSDMPSALEPQATSSTPPAPQQATSYEQTDMVPEFPALSSGTSYLQPTPPALSSTNAAERHLKSVSPPATVPSAPFEQLGSPTEEPSPSTDQAVASVIAKSDPSSSSASRRTSDAATILAVRNPLSMAQVRHSTLRRYLPQYHHSQAGSRSFDLWIHHA
jgi:hypothetical protein